MTKDYFAQFINRFAPVEEVQELHIKDDSEPIGSEHEVGPPPADFELPDIMEGEEAKVIGMDDRLARIIKAKKIFDERKKTAEADSTWVYDKKKGVVVKKSLLSYKVKIK